MAVRPVTLRSSAAAVWRLAERDETDLTIDAWCLKRLPTRDAPCSDALGPQPYRTCPVMARLAPTG